MVKTDYCFPIWKNTKPNLLFQKNASRDLPTVFVLHEVESDHVLRVTSGGRKPDEPDPRPQLQDVFALKFLGQTQIDEAEMSHKLFPGFVPIGADDLDDIVEDIPVKEYM